MKKLIILFILSVLFIMTSCKKDVSWEEEYSLKLCKKVVECSKEMIAKYPEAVRKQVAKKMPTVETCVKENGFNYRKKNGIKLSSQEVNSAKKCIDAISNSSCKTAMTFSAPECVSFKKNINKKKSQKK